MVIGYRKTPALKRTYRASPGALRQMALPFRSPRPYTRKPTSSIGQAYVRPRPKGPEMKFIDTLVTLNMDSAGSVTTCQPINLTSQGNTVFNRNGNAIKCMSVSLQGEIIGSGLPGGGSVQGTRLIMFWDTEPRGLNASAGDLLNSTDTNGQFNPSTLDRFKIIYDVRHVCGPQVQAAAGGPNANASPVIPIVAYRSLQGIQTVSNGALATVAAATTNILYILALGDTAFGLNQNPQLQCNVRIRFTDA